VVEARAKGFEECRDNPERRADLRRDDPERAGGTTVERYKRDAAADSSPDAIWAHPRPRHLTTRPF
jgi:hypothetical protein